jgi:hypothetical protein
MGVDDDGSISGCHRLTQEQINSVEKAAFVFCPEARTESKRIAATVVHPAEVI